MSNNLIFSGSEHNRKLRLLAEHYDYKYSKVKSFNLPAGYTCPAAKDCKSRADQHTGKITDNKGIKYRCYAASMESIYPNIRKMVWNNFHILQSTKNIYSAIKESLPKQAKIIRLHVSGDFYSQDYFLAWVNIAKDNPNIIFYGYSKRVDLFLRYRLDIPNNFHFTMSLGGLHDNLALAFNLPVCKVIYSPNDTMLPIVKDENLAILGGQSFALMIHGTQPVRINQAARLANPDYKINKRG
jgi:hypothetical protein